MTEYEKLKEVIQKANPQIVELKFGCEIEVIWTDGKTEKGIFLEPNTLTLHKSYGGELRTNGDNCGSCSFDKKEVRILGRPIRVSDVLLAFDYNSTSEQLKFGLSSNLFVIETKNDKAIWNLRNDNLDAQSDETKKFLIELLIIKKLKNI
jgi:hypothetical protein